MFKPGVVIPATKDRLDNLDLVLRSLENSKIRPEDILVITDGWEIYDADLPLGFEDHFENVSFHPIQKHVPGREQPRNVGVRYLSGSCNYVWFLDCDCLVLPETLSEYYNAYEYCPAIKRIMIGPYEWMSPGTKEPMPELYNDPRWDMFNRFSPKNTFSGHLGVALGNFSGNLMWPRKEFERVGGFWNDLHMGRCEDGELGIRACAMCVPMALVPKARAFHIHHEVNLPTIHEKNSRDVPMINRRHPYVEEQGLIVVNYDGKRFDQVCEVCGEQFNTNLYWSHATECQTADLYS